MKHFYYNKIGTGKINIILLSGWGISSRIWLFVIKNLIFFFRFHLIDLPGYGMNKNLSLMQIDEIIEILHRSVPRNSIWIGWSMGGLIASRFALSYPEKTLGLITVASSPCFIEKKNWPGIKKYTAYRFYTDMKENYYCTIENFLNLERITAQNNLKELEILKRTLLNQSEPTLKFLQNGLKIICSTDLREENFTKVPFLRIYGSLDNLVPKKIAKILDKKWPNTRSIVIKKASHTPFISHCKEFCSVLLNVENYYE